MNLFVCGLWGEESTAKAAELMEIP